VSVLGKTISVKGELRAAEDMTIEGTIDGPVFLEDHALLLTETSQVMGDIIARDITVRGQVAGQLVASDVVDVRAEARVSGYVVSPRFILDELASFKGRVEPQHLEAALRVAKFQQRKRDAAS
jgi:cytoskeletal protein CcmA (bactofilin family)